MRVLIFDTETTGLPKTKYINTDTLKLWPYIVQFSYIIFDTTKNDILETCDNVVKVYNGVNIPEESIVFHGITNKMSQEKGVDIFKILNEFCCHLKNVDMLVGHNISFDINMVKVELHRIIYENSSNISENEINSIKSNLILLTNFNNVYCTLQKSINLCDIIKTNKFGKTYKKFPKLVELHQKLFTTTPNNLHNSFNDILVTLRCFMKLKYDVDLNETCEQFNQIAKNINLL